MKLSRVTPVILAGGTGTRLWPVSRKNMPKQFCRLNDEPSLFQQTVKRLCEDALYAEPIILTNANYSSIVKQQMDEVGVAPNQIICEPCGRDTAPAVAIAALVGKAKELDLLLVLPSDHKVADSEEFIKAARKSAEIAGELDKIVTFGICPTEPATGYGYLEANEEIEGGLGHILSSFIEKPDRKKAEKLIAKDNVYWNAGIFMFSPQVMCRELEAYAPELYGKVQRSLEPCDLSSPMITPEDGAFSEIEPISIDYAVMEKTSDAALVPVDPQWSDVGSWSAVWEASVKDGSGNVVSGDALCAGTDNSFILTDGPFVGVAGISDVVVVANRDAVLVTSRNNSESVKALTSDMKKSHEQLMLTHVSEKRPWGTFTSINKGENHQVKSITVEPGGQLSLQYHHYRAERWIVVVGTPTVTVNEEVMELSPFQQVFIPQGAVHRLENLTDDPVQIIEVQYGSYLGEDDIVRVSDVYGRPDTEQPVASENVA